MHRDTGTPSLPWTGLGIVAITILAPWLWGSARLPGEAALFFLAGLLMLCSPKPFLNWYSPVIWLCLAWLLLAATAFLPLSWFPETNWRRILTLDFDIPLGTLYSPQPWLSLKAILLFGGSLFWGIFLLSHRWNSSQRRSLVTLFCLGVTLLATACLVAQFMGLEKWVGGGGDARLGPFPNKNQSAHLFGLAGILAMGMLRESIHRRSPAAFFWWIPPIVFLPCLFALQSRGGFAVFAFGVFFLSFPRRWKANDLAGSAILLSVLLLGTAALILIGTPLMDRLLGSIGTQKSDFRIGMYKDVFGMMKDLPWNGAGLGNFSDLFALWRQETAGTFNRVIHPDSDWSWMGAELGWITFLIAPLVLITSVAPAFGRKIHESTWVDRSIGLALLASFFYSFIEVSAHVLGTAWPLIFLISLAAQSSYHQASGKGGRWIFPLGGLAMAALGALALASVWGKLQLPTPWYAASLEKQAEALVRQRAFKPALENLDRSLAIHPLNAHAYLLRGVTHAYLKQDDQARDDFSRTRYLEPVYPNYSMTEGLVWKNTRPLRTIAAWNETLSRARIEPGTRQQFFDQMITQVGNSPVIRPQLVDWAMQDPLLAIVLFERDSPAQFQTDLNLWRGTDPNLAKFNPQQRFNLIQLWFEKGDISELEFFLSSNYKKLSLFWSIQAEIQAKRGEYEDALALTHRFLKFPPQPPVPNDPLPKLKTEASLNPDNILASLRLLSRLVADGRFDEAVHTLQSFKTDAEFPDYYYTLAAEAYRQTHDLKKSWEAMQVLVRKQQPSSDSNP